MMRPANLLLRYFLNWFISIFLLTPHEVLGLTSQLRLYLTARQGYILDSGIKYMMKYLSLQVIGDGFNIFDLIHQHTWVKYPDTRGGGTRLTKEKCNCTTVQICELALSIALDHWCHPQSLATVNLVKIRQQLRTADNCCSLENWY